MKSSKLVKIVLIITTILSMILLANQVFAQDLTDTLKGDSTTAGNVLKITGNDIINNVNDNKINNIQNNEILKTNNISNYNNSSLPKTGVEDTIPGVILVVVLGISAVYAYKKMQDYKNI